MWREIRLRDDQLPAEDVADLIQHVHLERADTVGVFSHVELLRAGTRTFRREQVSGTYV